MTDNKDLNQRFDKLEARLESLASIPDPRLSPLDSRIPAASRSDEIDLRELFVILWQGKWWVIGVAFLFMVAGVFYALSLPDMYRSQVIAVSADADSKGGLGTLASQYGGVAAMAGIDLSGGGDRVEQAVELLKSWPFLESFISKYQLKPYLFAVAQWDAQEKKLRLEHSLYDQEGGAWRVKSGVSLEPTSWQAYRAMLDLLTIVWNEKTGMLVIAVEHQSPVIAKQWVELLLSELNEHYQQKDMIAAQSNVEYLTQKISDTSIAEMQALLYGMVEGQIKNLMLAEVRDEYLLEVVVPPKISEKEFSPKRPLLIVVFFVIGVVFSLLGVFLRFLVFAK